MTQFYELRINHASDMASEDGKTRRFDLGRVVITRNAAERLNQPGWIDGLRRHACGDWGELCPEDRQANDAALMSQERILSAYRDHKGEKFWIITEWDRSLTTILLPEDY